MVGKIIYCTFGLQFFLDTCFIEVNLQEAYFIFSFSCEHIREIFSEQNVQRNYPNNSLFLAFWANPLGVFKEYCRKFSYQYILCIKFILMYKKFTFVISYKRFLITKHDYCSCVQKRSC